MKKLISATLALCMVFTAVLFPLQAGAVETADLKDAEVIRAEDYIEYVNEDKGNDWALAIQRMIEDAKAINAGGDVPVVISFPEGTYDIYEDQAYKKELYISNTVGANQDYKIKNIGFLFEGMKNVVLEGNGSLFMFHGRMMTFAAIDCTNVTYQNLSFDFKVPSVIDVTVESVNEGGRSVTVVVPECFNYEVNGTTVTWKSDVSPYSGNTYWTATNALANVANQIYDANTGLTVRAGTKLFNGLSSISEISDHKLKLTYSGNVPDNVKAGCSYQMRNTTRDHSAMFFWKSEGVTLKDVNAHFLYGFGVVGQNSSDITLDGVHFDVPEGSGRSTAGFADFVQMSGCRGEIRVENCTFVNPHDDPINIHGTFMRVVRKSSDNKTFTVRYMHNETAGFPNFFEGDQVEFMTAGNMTRVADSVATVVDVKGPSGDAGAQQSGTGSLTDIEITLDRALPDISPNTHVVENITYTPSAVIQNNVFKQVPTRGILVTTRKKVEIKDNLFDGMGMASIYISNDAQGWYESGPVEDVTIEGNTFVRPSAGAAVIFIEPTNPSVSTEKPIHENIVINNNTFFMQNGQVLNAKCTKDLSFTDNHLYRYDPHITLTLSASGEMLRAGKQIKLMAQGTGNVMSSNLYAFNGCKEVYLDGNYYDGGLKLNASTNNMGEADIIVGAEEGVVVNGSANVLPAVKNIMFESSDERILKIEADGTATGLAPGTVTVRAYVPAGGEKLWSNEVTVTVTDKVAAQENAYLESAVPSEGISFDQPFNSDGSSYTGSVGKEMVSLNLKAEQADAQIEAILDGKSVGRGKGSLNAPLSIHGGINKVDICVTSPNGAKEKVYRFTLNGSSTAYLSDLSWDDSQSSGGNGKTAVKDKSTDNNPLTLLAEDGTDRVFEKGLGVHAPCTLVYDIEGLGYTAFSSYVGIDQEITKPNEPDVKVLVYGDGKLLKQTETIIAATPMELITVDITGVRELKLIVEKLEHDWSDHVDFADAKLISPLQGQKEVSVIRYSAEPKAGGTLLASTGGLSTENGFIPADDAAPVTLTARAAAGYTFLGWYDAAGKQCTTDAAFTVSGIKADAAFTAKFAASNRPQLETAVNSAIQKELSGFTAESAAAYRAALAAAQAVLNKADALPGEIEKALNDLKKAETDLKAVQTPPDNKDQIPQPQPGPVVIPATGSTFDINGFRYKVTKSSPQNGTVTLIKAVGKKKGKLTVPPSVKKDGFTFTVTKINKKAFQNNLKITGITIGKNITNIGANAFNGCKKLQNITFKSIKAPKIAAKAFKGIAKKAKITIPKKMSLAQRKNLKRRMASAGIGKNATYKTK